MCRICHNALELIEPSICSGSPDIRYFKGGEAVEVLEHPKVKNGWKGRWRCKVVATGEIREISTSHLYYLPKKMERKEDK